MNIRLEHLDMTYPGGKRALQDISLTLSAPGLVGLLGPNGAGKSTLMKLLVAGLLPTAGTLTVDEKPLQSCEAAYKAKLGYLPQSFGLFEELTVLQFLDYMAALKGLQNPKALIEQTIVEVNLEEKRKNRIRSLSGGQRQRVGIAQALLGCPELLIFDEPTVGLDPEERIHFRNLFSRLAQKKLVLLSTHIIEDVQSVCDSLVIIHSGQILFKGTPTALLRQTKGHVGVFYEQDGVSDAGLHITARHNTARGVLCRMVAQTLPVFAREAEPNLEDAYLFTMIGEEAK